MPPGLRGRQPQVDALRGQLDALGAGRGGVVLLRGPAGSGKTTLLAEAARLATDQNIRVFRGGGDPAARAVPLGAVLDALVSVAAPPVDPERVHELSQSPDQRFWLLRELQESLEKAAQRMPLLIVIDDLQWADAATTAAVVTLSRRLATHRIGWLLALRAGELADAAQDAVGRLEAAGATEIRLGPLEDSAVAQVASDTLGGEPDEALQQVLARADGQPFLLTELLRGLREEHLVSVADGTARLAAGAGLPRRFVDSVASQLARLTPDARDAVEMASVLGHSFSLEELAGLLGRPPLDLRGAIRGAIAAGLLAEDGDRLRFRHDLVRDAVDASLPKAVRRSLRRTAIEVMLRHGASAADVAQLVMDVAVPGDIASAGLLHRAAEQIGRISPAVALPLSQRALDLTPHGDPARSEAAVQAIDLLVQAGRAAEAAKLMTASEGDLADPAAEAQARLAIAMLMTQYAPAAVAEQCQAALRRPGVPPRMRVQLLSLLACGLDISGEADTAAGPVADAIGEAAVIGDPAAEIVTFVPRALLAFAQGDWRGAIDLASEAVTRQHEAKDLGLWLPETWKSLLLISELRLDEAHAIIEAGTREAENVSKNIRVWSMLRCRARLAAGQLADARAEAEAILSMSDEIGDGNFGYLNHIASYALGDIALRTGDPVALQAARRNAAAMYRTATGCGTTRRLGAWLTVRLDGGPIGPDLLDILAPGQVHASGPLAHCDASELVRLLLAAGQRSDAASVASLLEQAASANPGFPGLAPAALHARALADSDPERAVVAAQEYIPDPRPLVRAAALEDAGRLLPEGAKKEAVGYLDKALSLQSGAGAERDAARLRRLLRDRGVQRASGRPDPAAAQWPELTSSELAVVRLVTQGATDREVAERLFISAHTVNSHLRHVFTKLGIRSRVELARLAGERQPELSRWLLEQICIGVHEGPRGDRLLLDHAAEGIRIGLGQAACGVDGVGLVDEQRTAAVRERAGRRELAAFQQPVQVGAVSGPDRRDGVLVLDIADVVCELHGHLLVGVQRKPRSQSAGRTSLTQAMLIPAIRQGRAGMVDHLIKSCAGHAPDGRLGGMSAITITPRTVRHVQIATGRPYEKFREEYEAAVPAFDRLEAIGVVTSGAGWAGIENLSRNTAVHGLVSFFTFDPSPVMRLKGSTRRGVTYLSGNIVEAEKGFRVDPACFLYLPLRVIIAEASDGTAVLGVDVPNDLFGVFPEPGMADVGGVFTRTFGLLLQHLGLPVPQELGGTDGDE